ncbi:C-type lectin 37Db-like [Drosophila innubila]|uniref:C-type lectin 37Db-like n=1 Tax=Drosophila innubila TaxID=198719 RepID=UPI00148CC33C|nr:C-type lectin 37Db-like [Drosophila innubila]
MRFSKVLIPIVNFVLLQLHQASSDNGCKADFSQVAGKCLLTTLNLYNWKEADRHCNSLGAGLLSLENEAQLEQISQWLNVTEPWIYEFWTSGNSLGHKGSYYWESNRLNICPGQRVNLNQLMAIV